MAITLAHTAVDQGAALANYVKVTGLTKRNGLIEGVEAEDAESGARLYIKAKVVVNATGIFSDALRKLDDPAVEEIIEPAQGVHLVLDSSFGMSNNAIMVPHTDDGRVLFVIPWHGRVIVGTTDTAMDAPQLEPRALPDEVEFILRNASRYMKKDPTRADVLSVFAGQRPLVHPGGKSGSSKSISRSHEVFVSPSGLVTIAGGKWTTYRKMAEDTLTHVIEVGNLKPAPCTTEQLRLWGYMPRESADFPAEDHLRVYGTCAAEMRALATQQPELANRLHDSLPYIGAEIAWAVRNEMARKLEDVLARRTRSLLLGARASSEAAGAAASIMARELGRDERWIADETAEYQQLAAGYLLE